MEALRHKDRFLRHTLSIPFIYWAWIWLIILDVFVEIYHRICFPLYWIPLVDRKKYFIYKRHKLEYLNIVDKFNCAYCSYWNWLMWYAKEIVAQTEKYWCWIKNPPVDIEWFYTPEHHKDFIPYWDVEAFIKKTNSEQKNNCKLLD